MNYAVIFAGGIGSRMTNSNIPKQFIEVNRAPIIIHTIKAFERNKIIDGICIVCIESWINRLEKYIDTAGLKKVKWIVSGAETGQQSIYNGLKAIYDDNVSLDEDIVLINDSVRPFVSQRIIGECVDCVKAHGSAITVCPVPETIGEISDTCIGLITDIPDRNKWYLLKAPQCFFLGDIIEAHNKAIVENRYDCTNSAELMRRYGHTLFTVIDTPNNIKVTTPIDVSIMKAVIDEGIFDE